MNKYAVRYQVFISGKWMWSRDDVHANSKMDALERICEENKHRQTINWDVVELDQQIRRPERQD